MLAPERFAEWLTQHEHVDRRLGLVYHYHSRSDAHSIALCEMILDDLLAACPALHAHAASEEIAYGVNLRHTWPNGKSKTIDLAIGTPFNASQEDRGQARIGKAAALADVLISLEAKAVMTEHGKSQPRVYDELSSSHEIVHQGSQEAIAAGVTVVNIADTFVSPLRQRPGEPLVVTRHNQPSAAMSMVRHLRALPVRNSTGEVGFDAYATIVVNCDNQGPTYLHTAPPAPQPGDPDQYATFLGRISQLYAERFAILPKHG
jgi:hypothetical protein